MIRSIVVLPDGDIVRHHVGAGRVAARAHRDGREQLLGTQIAHATRESSAVRALVIGMVRTALGRGEVALAGSPYHTSADLRTARRAVALAAIAATAQHDQRAANAA